MRTFHTGPPRRFAVSEKVQRHRSKRLACMAAVLAAMLGCLLPQVAKAESELSTGLGTSTELGATAEPAISLTPSTTKPYTLCPPGGRMIECNLVVDPPAVATPSGYRLPDGGPILEGSGENGGLNPVDLQSAYRIPTSGGSGETVAIVDAYGYEDAESDLAKYREKNSLPPCTKTNGCFKKVNQKGEEASYPVESGPLAAEWSLEQALDVDMVSAACQNCKILLVEASTQAAANTAASVEEAARLKATEISNSYGYPENNESLCPSKKGCKEYLSAYNQPGIPVTVSAGDTGYDDSKGAPSWPATSPNIIAVGGTALKKAENARGWTETAWIHSGSGCSLYESKPTWQKDKGCEHRTDNDVASDASYEESPVAIYNTPYYAYIHEEEGKEKRGGWLDVGGTSAGSPLIAGVEAHATSATKKLGAEAFYKKPSMLFHVSEGSNGSCGAEGSETYYLCNATKEGYNGPTGWGTPDGVFSNAGPYAVTGMATGIGKTEATLTGTVNPNGVETKYYFEYGTTTSYGTKTAEVSDGSGTSNVEVSKSITGLTAGTRYDFRIVATNTSKETNEGSNQVFNTLPNAPGNTVLPATSLETPDQAVPETTTPGTWTNSPTGYEYQWERCNASGGECVAIPGATSATYTPVEADVAHTLVVKVTAKNSGGSSSARSKATSSVNAIGQITEYPVSSVGFDPSGIATGPDGNLWFTAENAEIGKITTAGVTSKYSATENSGLDAITAGPDGDLWFTEYQKKGIGKITTSGAITEYTLPESSHPRGITKGPDGNLWFTESSTHKIGKITTSSVITEYSLPGGSTPERIVAGADGNLWFTAVDPAEIGKITTSGALTEYSLSKENDPNGITAGPGGNLWFTEGSKIGKITTSGVVTEYPLANGGDAVSIAAGPDGNLWFTDEVSNEIGRITTAGTVTEYALPTKSRPTNITVGPDDEMWFTDTSSDNIAKIAP
jgi:streptogramin lyase